MLLFVYIEKVNLVYYGNFTSFDNIVLLVTLIITFMKKLPIVFFQFLIL